MLQNLTLHPQRDGSLLPGDDTVVVLTIGRRNTRYFKTKASAARLYRIAVRTWWSSGTQPMRGRLSFDIAVWLQNMFFPCTTVLRRIIPRTLDAPILLFICTLFDGCAAIPSHLNIYSGIKKCKDLVAATITLRVGQEAHAQLSIQGLRRVISSHIIHQGFDSDLYDAESANALVQ